MLNFDLYDTIFSSLDFLQRWLNANNIFEIILKGSLIYIGILWLAIIIWVTRDVINRSNNILFQVISILLNTILPVFGLVIYLLIRPSKTILEKYYDEAELKALSLGKFCEICNSQVNEAYDFCPECGKDLKNKCNSCKKTSLKTYKICPYCGKNKDKKDKNLKKKPFSS